MRKISRNFSLPPIKISNNSTQVDIKPFSISKTTNTINNQKSKSQFNKNKLQNNLLIYIKFPPLNDKEKQILTNEIISIKDTKNIALINPDDKKNIIIILIISLMKMWIKIPFLKRVLNI